MKTYSLYCLLLVSCLASLLSGCANDYPSIPNKVWVLLPEQAEYFLSDLFPGQIPTDLEEVNPLESEGGYTYKVSFEDGESVTFDKEGLWMQIKTPNHPLSEWVSLFFFEMEAFVKENYSTDCITDFTQTFYGLRVGLQSGRWLAFSSKNPSSLIGHEVNLADGVSLPTDIKTFLATYFPEVASVLAVRGIADGAYLSTYTVWLQNQFRVVFDAETFNWVAIDGGQHVLPASFIESLPEEVKERLRDYPDANITRVEIIGGRYYIHVNENTTVIVDPNQKPVVLPYIQIRDFVKKYFGDTSRMGFKYVDYTNPPFFTVSLPNGFNFDVNENGDWLSMNGHGYPFSDALAAGLLPGGIIDYLSSHDATVKISRVNKTKAFGFRIVLTNGQGVLFDGSGVYLGLETVVLTPFEKTYTYIRYHYPEEYNISFDSFSSAGWIYRLADGTEVRFNREGERI